MHLHVGKCASEVFSGGKYYHPYLVLVIRLSCAQANHSKVLLFLDSSVTEVLTLDAEISQVIISTVTAKMFVKMCLWCSVSSVEPESCSQVSEKLVLNALCKVTMCTRAISIVFVFTLHFTFYILLHTQIAMHTGRVTIKFPRHDLYQIVSCLGL